MRVKYVSTEEFTNDFINSLRDDRKVAFKRSYRDRRRAAGRRHPVHRRQRRQSRKSSSTPFNTLHNANKQIVISSDRPPKQLATT